jgi:multimeric flavodoxin WrbA
MKTLIITGSPRKNGDTAALVSELKAKLNGEVAELSAYRDKISPCIDCRYCYDHAECSIKDDMQTVYNDDYDALVIASPVHFSNLSGRLMSLLSRLQIYHTAQFMRNSPIYVRPKLGALMLTGGGKGSPDGAIRMGRAALRILGVRIDEQNIVKSLNTDELPAGEDRAALQQVREIAERLNAGI